MSEVGSVGLQGAGAGIGAGTSVGGSASTAYLARDGFRDVIDFLKNSDAHEAKGFQRILTWLPKGLRPRLGQALEKFCNLPGVRQCPGIVKGGILIEAAIGSFLGIKNTISGFQQSQGGFFTRLFDGLWSGVKSLFKSAIGSVVSLGLAFGIPMLMRIPLAGPWGIALGIGANLIIGSPIRGILEKWIPTHSHIEGAREGATGEGLKPEDYRDNLPQVRNAVIREIDHLWETKAFNPFIQNPGPNPWLSGLSSK